MSILKFKQFESKIAKLAASKINKEFLWIDNTGRMAKKTKYSIDFIYKHWDLTDISNDDDIELEEWLESCEIGDKWRTIEGTLSRIK